MEKVETFNKITDEMGNVLAGFTKMHISHDFIDEEGNVLGQQNSPMLITVDPGYIFGVKSHVPEQYRKMKIVNGELFVKDGEVIEEPVKTPEQIRVEELEKELAVLKGQPLTE